MYRETMFIQGFLISSFLILTLKHAILCNFSNQLISVKFVFQVEQQKCIKTRLRVLMLLTSSMVDIILLDTC